MGELNMRGTTPLWARLLFLAAAAILTLCTGRPAQAQGRVHVVAGGENLSSIAQHYGLSLQELAAYNGIANPNLVFSGQRLEIPGLTAAPSAMAPATSETLPGDSGYYTCLLYTSDAADDLLCVDLGGRRFIKNKLMRTPSHKHNDTT